ncbi:MAG: RNA-binding S4 domain-containing protein [Sphingomonadales bacterium]|nr:RNA-binding S4 domain-containing protein [Sphingomonadales bacterium]
MGAIRLDKLLWFLRLAKTRERAQAWIGEGHIRLNGRRVERQSQGVVPGDVLVLPLAQGVRVIELAAIPARRGPAPEAQSCYRVLDETRAYPIAAVALSDFKEGDPPP